MPKTLAEIQLPATDDPVEQSLYIAYMRAAIARMKMGYTVKMRHYDNGTFSDNSVPPESVTHLSVPKEMTISEAESFFGNMDKRTQKNVGIVMLRDQQHE